MPKFFQKSNWIPIQDLRTMQMNELIAVANQYKLTDLFELNDYQNYYNLNSCDEYQATLRNFQLTLGLAHSTKQLNQIYQLRENVYQDKMSYLLNCDDGLPASADRLDASSYIFYCRHNDRTVASCRYTPSINGEWESPEITSVATLVPADKSQLLQVGRLLIIPEYRSQMLSEIMIWASCHWLYHKTSYNSFYAICNPALVRFYRHFGAKSVAKTKITLPERQNQTYRLVYGFVDSVAQTLHNYVTTRGWSLSSPNNPAKVYF
ncbi:MAG: GNAT family N-acetyltransferase [Richelia sp. RM1_1_1]|nr:GNAT family N-acetyltransferase [Richelia sp. RM1_1_1]